MMARLIFNIISTLMEEIALVVIALWGLPQIGVHIPLPGLFALMVAWAAYTVITYRLGSRALKRKPLITLPDMVGSKGEVVSFLGSEGMVRIKGELWIAKSNSGEMKPGDKVVVIEQDSLKLVVRPE
ncbi:MAG: hypothetical protein HY529_01945 [Chloroflexi bacterium]|nr:hypothetical protein [Chloroflexota bacterium]